MRGLEVKGTGEGDELRFKGGGKRKGGRVFGEGAGRGGGGSDELQLEGCRAGECEDQGIMGSGMLMFREEVALRFLCFMEGCPLSSQSSDLDAL